MGWGSSTPNPPAGGVCLFFGQHNSSVKPSCKIIILLSFQGQHMPGKLGAVSSEDDEDDFSPYGETSRDEAKEG